MTSKATVAVADVPADKTARLRLLWMGGVLAVVALRLLLTSDRDILATFSPHDEFWYVHRAARGIWGGDYDELAFAHLPIYAIWLWASRLLGVPARLGIDVGWLVANGYLALSLRQLTGRAWIAGLLFVYLAFHPYSLVVFDRAFAETLLAVLSAAALAGGIELWNCRDRGWSRRHRAALVVYVGAFASAFHVRKEGVLMLAPLLVLGIGSWIDRERWWRSEGRRVLALPLLVAPLVATLGLGTLLAGANYIRWGLFARSDLGAPGYQSAVAALNRVNVGRTPRYVAVTAAARTAAYEISPTLTELRPFLEGEMGRQWSSHSGIPGEIGNGWFYWALRDAAARAGWHKDSATAEAKYFAVSQEINRGFDTGRLHKHRFAAPSFIDPDIGKWIAFVPSSTVHVLELVGHPFPALLLPRTEDASPTQWDEFVRIAGRRNLPPRPGVAGWVILPPGSAIGFGTADAAFSWSLLEGPERHDVPGGYSFNLTPPAESRPTALHVRVPDGRRGAVLLAALREGKVARLGGAVDALIGIESMPLPPLASRLDRWFSRDVNWPPGGGAWLSPFCKAYGILGTAGFLLAAAFPVLGWLMRREQPAVVMVFLVAGAGVLGRGLLFGILDASSWNGLQPRYLLPAVPGFACMAALVMALGIAAAGRKGPGTERSGIPELA